jgi:hypothetical protein
MPPTTNAPSRIQSHSRSSPLLGAAVAVGAGVRDDGLGEGDASGDSVGLGDGEGDSVGLGDRDGVGFSVSVGVGDTASLGGSVVGSSVGGSVGGDSLGITGNWLAVGRPEAAEASEDAAPWSFSLPAPLHAAATTNVVPSRTQIATTRGAKFAPFGSATAPPSRSGIADRRPAAILPVASADTRGALTSRAARDRFGCDTSVTEVFFEP